MQVAGAAGSDRLKPRTLRQRKKSDGRERVGPFPFPIGLSGCRDLACFLDALPLKLGLPISPTHPHDLQRLGRAGHHCDDVSAAAEAATIARDLAPP